MPLAGATQIVPVRKASPLPSPTSEISSPTGPVFSPPGIVVSDHPDAPATLIPATDGSSTRPTKGGIAYPFSLQAGGANASMLTLDSVGITTPPAVDVQQSEKEPGNIDPVIEPVKEAGAGQPATEHFYTAGPGTGAGLFSSGVKPDEVEGAQKVERPPAERFETAQEDLNMLANGTGKA